MSSSLRLRGLSQGVGLCTGHHLVVVDDEIYFTVGAARAFLLSKTEVGGPLGFGAITLHVDSAESVRRVALPVLVVRELTRAPESLEPGLVVLELDPERARLGVTRTSCFWSLGEASDLLHLERCAGHLHD